MAPSEHAHDASTEAASAAPGTRPSSFATSAKKLAERRERVPQVGDGERHQRDAQHALHPLHPHAALGSRTVKTPMRKKGTPMPSA